MRYVPAHRASWSGPPQNNARGIRWAPRCLRHLWGGWHVRPRSQRRRRDRQRRKSDATRRFRRTRRFSSAVRRVLRTPAMFHRTARRSQEHRAPRLHLHLPTLGNPFQHSRRGASTSSRIARGTKLGKWDASRSSPRGSREGQDPVDSRSLSNRHARHLHACVRRTRSIRSARLRSPLTNSADLAETNPVLSLLAITFGLFLIVPPFVSLYRTCPRIQMVRGNRGIRRTQALDHRRHPCGRPVCFFLIIVAGAYMLQEALNTTYRQYSACGRRPRIACSPACLKSPAGADHSGHTAAGSATSCPLRASGPRDGPPVRRAGPPRPASLPRLAVAWPPRRSESRSGLLADDRNGPIDPVAGNLDPGGRLRGTACASAYEPVVRRQSGIER